MKTIRSLIVLTLIVLIAGCSGKPSESAGRTILSRLIQSQSNGKIILIDFRQTNATENDPQYRMEYEAIIRFVEDGTWSKGMVTDSHIQYSFSNQSIGSGALNSMMADISGSIGVKSGEQRTIKDALNFEKTEKGWRGEDGQLY